MANPIQPKLRQLGAKIVQYRFLLVMVIFCFAGILLIAFPSSGHLGEVQRDLGIGLFVAGTVGLGVEFLVRKDMENEFREVVEETIEDSVLPRFGDLAGRIEDLRQAGEGASAGIDEVRDLLRNNHLREMGVRQIHPDREAAGFRKWLTGAESGNTIRLMALCLNPMTTHANEKLIRRKLKAGCKIRLLLLDPYSLHLDQRAHEEEPKSEAAFKQRVRKWAAYHQDFVESLEPALAEGFELGFYRAAPTCFIADNESCMLVGFYLHECRGDDCPHLELEVKPGGAYEPFRRHFDSVWAERLPWPERRTQDVHVPHERRRQRFPSAVEEPDRGAQAS